ncbi:hypothetical protein JTE90_020411 [Oedothorax gibbosus]|uniref:Sodium-dependent multivitamin transporter n=1 Tax=Oedothorax gibbosus TaxID=931172 RepID=A0AAV6UG10_9ARAC|nr:hypothetical protein JTE90_020411 [Oedothorax gibbosus]
MLPEKLVLGAVDYTLIAAALLVSAGIGVYFQRTSRKTDNNEDFVLGGRALAPFPVALSILATFMSALSLMGIPADVYMYGTNLAFANLLFLVAPVFCNYFFLPVFFGDHFTSVYEYLERRFGKLTRRLLSAMFSVQTGLFTAVALYAPALALSAVTNLSMWTSIISIGAICTFYCTLGGMKAVLWTDVFQACLMYTTLFVICIVGCIQLGGISKVFEMSYDGGRLVVPEFTTDISQHYTMYNIMAQGMLVLLYTYGGSQIALQRLMAVKDLKTSKLVTYLSIPLCLSFRLLCALTGLIVYAYFKECDPLTGPDRLIRSPDQLLPFFITNAMSHLPGLPGLCIAGIFSASLSTVSSAINSLAAVTYEDFLGPLLPVTKNKPVMWTKLLSLLYGVTCIVLSFVMGTIGTLIKTTILLRGVFAGPSLAVFALGMGSTLANEEGVVIGLIISIVLGFWLNFGVNVIREPFLPLEAACTSGNASLNDNIILSVDSWMSNVTTLPPKVDITPTDKFPVAYMWFSTIGLVVCLIIGYLCSIIINCIRGTTPEISEIYLSPMRTWFFKTKLSPNGNRKNSKNMDLKINPNHQDTSF